MDYKLVGSPCGEHGPYVFYKALKYSKNGKTNILALSEFFFVKLWPDSDFISIGELQLLWEDKNNEQTLASLRLYILPENTPDGRMDIHGEDEVLAITEKVVIRVEDLLTWITHATDWNWGLGAVWEQDCPQADTSSCSNIKIDMEDVNKEKQNLGAKHWETQTGVVVLSYPKYCRYRGIARRLEGVADRWLKTALVVALGGFTAPWKNTKVLFCKDTFDYPELEGHELLCNHLVPKLKGRPRKRKKASASPEESESESESSQSTSSSNSKAVPPSPKLNLVKPRLRCTALAVSTNRPNRGPGPDERNFLISLHDFMRERKTPIGKIPVVGFKEVNLYKLYRKVKELGGYDVVTTGKLWKFVYEVMGGDASCTSAATLSRRHYEKLLLPYERHMAQMKSTKLKPTLSLPPVPLPQDRGKTQTSMRSMRLAKQEKGEKENIPQRRAATAPQPPLPASPDPPKPTEAASNKKDDKSKSDDTPKSDDKPKSPNDKVVKNTTGGRDLGPLLKKQKLEILKEGGLEVTPVSGGNGSATTVTSTGQPSSTSSSNGPSTPVSRPPPPTARQSAPVARQSLPVSRQPVPVARQSMPVGKPSLSNGRPQDAHYRANGSDKVSITVTPDMSHLLCPPGPSKRAVYSNPKEMFSSHMQSSHPQSKRNSLPEVLDLRTKPRLNIGSNLEITLVPPKPRPAHQQQLPNAAPVPLLVNKKKSTPQPQHHHYKATPNTTPKHGIPLHQPYPGSYKPFVPVVDPLYFSGLYNAGLPAGLPALQQPRSHDQLAFYKELLKHQFPSLIRDGTTSITLVGQTPTSK
uniref:ARID domain-containing protein n=3 Tax=Lygus hesperus TaxID=30085 RepID=A0A0K8TI64_LYGHE